MFATEQNSGDIVVQLEAARPARPDARGDHLRAARDVRARDAGVEIEFVQLLQDMLGDLKGTRSRSK